MKTLGTTIKMTTPPELKAMNKAVFGKPKVGGKAVLPKNTKKLW